MLAGYQFLSKLLNKIADCLEHQQVNITRDSKISTISLATHDTHPTLFTLRDWDAVACWEIAQELRSYAETSESMLIATEKALWERAYEWVDGKTHHDWDAVTTRQIGQFILNTLSSWRQEHLALNYEVQSTQKAEVDVELRISRYLFEICSQVYNTTPAVRARHLRGPARSVSKATCSICGRIFIRLKDLQTHLTEAHKQS